MNFNDKDNHVDQPDQAADQVDAKHPTEFKKIKPTDYKNFSVNLMDNINNPKSPKQLTFQQQLEKNRQEAANNAANKPAVNTPAVNTPAQNTPDEDDEVDPTPTTAQHEKPAGSPETQTGTIKDKIDQNAGGINTLLASNSKEGAKTLGEVFEQTKNTLMNSLKNNVLTALLKDKYLGEDDANGGRKLTEIGKKVTEQIDKSFTNERMNNITFGLLNTIVSRIDASISKAGGNKEVEINNKVTLLLSLQQMISKGGMSDLSKLPQDVVKNLDISWDAIKSLQTNFNNFLKSKITEGGLDMTSKDTRRKSIVENSDFSALGIWLNKSKRDASIEKVVPTAFEHAFSYFDNQATVSNLMTELTSDSKDKPFDAENVKLVAGKNQPSDEDIKSFVDKMNNLAADMPKDAASQKLLKEKIAENKIDAMLDKLGGFKDIALQLMKWLKGSGIGEMLLNFFGKSFGLDKKDIDKLIDRPLIKAGIDTYMETIADGTKMSKEPYKSGSMQLETNGEKWPVKTEYFKNALGVVMVKEGDHFTCKKLDASNKLIPLDKVKDEKLYKAYITEVNGVETATLTMNGFISENLNTPVLQETLIATYKLKTDTDISQDVSKGLIDLNDLPSLEELFKTNPYLYNTEDIVGNALTLRLPALDAKVKAKGSTTDNQPAATPGASADGNNNTPPAAGATPPASPDQKKPDQPAATSDNKDTKGKKAGSGTPSATPDGTGAAATPAAQPAAQPAANPAATPNPADTNDD